MARTTPVVQAETVTWSVDRHEHHLTVGTPAWYGWLEEISTFAFVSDMGTFTARKEPRQHGGAYWKAYRKRDGKLHRAYLGKSHAVTIERLNAVAAQLSGNETLQVHQVSITPQSPNVIVTQQLTSPESTPKHNLPPQLTSLVGREQDAATVEQLLQRPEVRLLTLTGPAGVGKTRLALQIATDLLESYPDGVYFVNLAPLRDPDLVLLTVAQTLALRQVEGQLLLALLQASLQDKHLLLVLDNFEQVVRAAPQVMDLLMVCPQLKVLVTSRQVLHLRTEHLFPVPPLALPDLDHLPEREELAQYVAVSLFLQRAQALLPGFQLTEANARVIAEICVHLDGLPLAIELAAARVRLLPPQALLARLSQRLAVLTGGAQDVPARQQTLRNTIAWSYDLLTAQEQRLLRCLSVFVGGFTLEEAEAVSKLSNETEPGAVSALDVVGALLDKSLLLQGKQEGEESRLTMLETIGEYGLECLSQSGELELTRRAHAVYYLQLSEQAEPELRGLQQALWLNRLKAEHDNLRAALGWALENGEGEIGLRLVGALWRFWMLQGYFTEGRGWLERVQERSSDAAPALQAKAFTGAGSMAWSQGNYQQAMRWHQQALALYREVGDKQGIAFALNNLGNQVQYQGDYKRARAFLEESLALYRELGDQWGIAIVLGNLGLGEAWQGDYERARVLFEENLALSRELQAKADIALALHNLGDVARYQGDHWGAMVYLEECLAVCEELGDKRLTAMTLNILGLVARWQGNFARSAALHTESLALSRELGEKLCIVQSLEGLADVFAVQGELAWAARLWGAAEDLREAINAPLPPIDRAAYKRAVAAARVSLGEKALATAWAEGRTMTPEQALASLEPATYTGPSSAPSSPSAIVTPAPKASTSPDGLTVREVEVLRLLAQGLTSAQIAEQLVIGVVTVNFHVRSIYSKLGVSSRSAATRYAIEHHLV